MLINVKNVTVESVSKGKAKWEKVTVDYEDDKGNTRKKYLVSFANPGVFTVMKEVTPGTQVNITAAKNDKDEWDWAKAEVVKAGGAQAAAAPAASGGKYVSDRETPEERAKRQLMIVRQSSISNAIEFYKHPKFTGSDFTVSDVLDIAQEFVDFVYGNNDMEALDGNNGDVPF